MQTMSVFNGLMYVGVSNRDDGAMVMEYDGKEWKQVNAYGFGNKANTAVSRMTTGDRLYVGTSNRSGGEVWAYDGKEWECLHRGKFREIVSGTIQSMAFYKDKLYIGLWDQTTLMPAEVWCYSKEQGWSLANEPGFGSELNRVANGFAVSSVDGTEKLYAIVWKNFQYKGPDSGCEVWSYDEKEWVKINNGREGFGEYGKGRPGMEALSITDYNGKLYVGLWAFATGKKWEVWVYDGRDWAFANKDVDQKNNTLLSCYAMKTYNGCLYVVAADVYKSFELWRYDEKNWVSIVGKRTATPEELGDYDNKIINAMTVYQDHLFIGVTNDKAGYKIFKSVFPKILPDKNVFSPGEIELFVLSNDAKRVKWYSSNADTASIDQSTGLLNVHKSGSCSIFAKDAFGYKTDPLKIEVKKTSAKPPEKILLYAEAYPQTVINDRDSRLNITARPFTADSTSQIKSITADISSITGKKETLVLSDRGTNRHNNNKDKIYFLKTLIPRGTLPGKYEVKLHAVTDNNLEAFSLVSINVKSGYTVPEITAFNTMGTKYHIPVLFTLKNEDGDICSVKFEYSSNKKTWQPATVSSKSGTPDSPFLKNKQQNRINGLTTNRKENHYVCVWKSDKDLPEASENYYLRITPHDKRSAGKPLITGPIPVNNQTVPKEEMVYVAEGDFYIDKYEFPNRFGYYPKVNLTWEEAQQECHNTGKELCTPEQWEAAYYGNSKKPYPYGEDSGTEGRDYCNTHGSTDDTSVPSGLYENCVNDLGIYDMGGNVYEWASRNENEIYMADQSYVSNTMDINIMNPEAPGHMHAFLGLRCCKHIPYVGNGGRTK